MRNATLEEDITVEIPEYPFPYFRGKNGGVYKRGISSEKAKKKDEDDEEERDVLVYEYDFYVVKRLTDPDAGESLWMHLNLTLAMSRKPRNFLPPQVGRFFALCQMLTKRLQDRACINQLSLCAKKNKQLKE